MIPRAAGPAQPARHRPATGHIRPSCSSSVETGERKNQFPTQLHDLQCAVHWLRANADEYGIDAERIGAYGNDAGADWALLLGASLEEAPELYAKASPITYLDENDPPVLRARAPWRGVDRRLLLVGVHLVLDRLSGALEYEEHRYRRLKGESLIPSSGTRNGRLQTG